MRRNQDPDVGDRERHEVGQPDLEPDERRGMTGHDHVQLIDGEKDSADDQRSGQGAPQILWQQHNLERLAPAAPGQPVLIEGSHDADEVITSDGFAWLEALAEGAQGADSAVEVGEHASAVGAPADMAFDMRGGASVEFAVNVVGHERSGLAAAVAVTFYRVELSGHAGCGPLKLALSALLRL